MDNTTAVFIASSCERFLVYPLDLLKTRLQRYYLFIVKELFVFLSFIHVIISKSFYNDKQYNSAFRAFLAIRKEPSGLRSFYRGLTPSMLSVFPLMASRGASFYFFTKSGITTHASGSIFYGIMIGITESLIITPFDAVKISLQTKSNSNLTKFEFIYLLFIIIYYISIKIKLLKGFLKVKISIHTERIFIEVWELLHFAKRKFSFFMNFFLLKDLIPIPNKSVYATASISAFRYYHQKYSHSLDEVKIYMG